MGTRADFYTGLREPEWIASIYRDGHPWNIACKILIQVNKMMYEETVFDFVRFKNGLIPNDKSQWPWPWPDGRLSDYSYFFSKAYGKVYTYSMNDKIMFDPLKIMQGDDLNSARVDILVNFPRMRNDIKYGSEITNVI
jgi:hypothetical protein